MKYFVLMTLAMTMLLFCILMIQIVSAAAATTMTTTVITTTTTTTTQITPTKQITPTQQQISTPTYFIQTYLPPTGKLSEIYSYNYDKYYEYYYDYYYHYLGSETCPEHYLPLLSGYRRNQKIVSQCTIDAPEVRPHPANIIATSIFDLTNINSFLREIHGYISYWSVIVIFMYMLIIPLIFLTHMIA
jgi:hypothetical protein